MYTLSYSVNDVLNLIYDILSYSVNNVLNLTFDILRAQGNYSLVHSAIRCIALTAAARWVLLGYGSTGRSPLGTAGVRFTCGWADISRG